MSAWRGSLTLALITGSLLSQGVRATLVGRITDGSGAVIPNAKIKLANPASGDERNAQSSGTGDFVLPQLTPGEYVLTVEHAGFNTEVRRGIVLETGQEARVDITLKAGVLTQEINVSAPRLRSFRARTLRSAMLSISRKSSNFP